MVTSASYKPFDRLGTLFIMNLKDEPVVVDIPATKDEGEEDNRGGDGCDHARAREDRPRDKSGTPRGVDRVTAARMFVKIVKKPK